MKSIFLTQNTKENTLYSFPRTDLEKVTFVYYAMGTTGLKPTLDAFSINIEITPVSRYDSSDALKKLQNTYFVRLTLGSCCVFPHEVL